jgi:hypothetical protein
MEKPRNTPMGVSDAGTSLQQLVAKLVNDSLPTAFHNKTNIVNEVEQEVVIENNSEKVITVMKDLLQTVVQNSNNGDIHIYAECFRDIIILQIQERNNYNGYALSFSIGAMEPDAINAGGHISIDGPGKRVATISFSFPALFAA